MPNPNERVLCSPGLRVCAPGRLPGALGCLATGPLHQPRGISLRSRCTVLLFPQEWIKDTQNVSHVAKTEATEQECVPEETLVVQLQKAEAEMPIVTTGPLCPPMEGEEASRDASPVACQPPQGGEVVSLGGFTFVMTDNSYMLL